MNPPSLSPVSASLFETRRLPRWLLVGKGPSAARLRPEHCHGAGVLTLNHACRLPAVREAPRLLCHFTDLEAFQACVPLPEDAVAVLPWRPHVGMAPGPPLAWQLEAVPALADLARQGRLRSYNSSRVPAEQAHRHWLTIRVRYFSGVAGFNLLAVMGVREIVCVGLDGGTRYAPQFDAKDCLANGRASFDAQRGELRRTQLRKRVRCFDLDGKELHW